MESHAYSQRGLRPQPVLWGRFVICRGGQPPPPKDLLADYKSAPQKIVADDAEDPREGARRLLHVADFAAK